MKKIGFVDYYLSEWHANNYPVWIKETCERMGLDYTVAYAWAEKEISPVDGRSSREWCEAFGVTLCETVGELCEKSDVIVILAPSDPDTHLRLCSAVLPYGKRTYVDKTFAPDLATAEEIFAIAKAHGTPFFSSSALRYAEELAACPDCRQMMVTASGSSVNEYIIHPVEMIVKKLGIGADRIRMEDVGDQKFFRIGYPDGRAAAISFGSRFPYTVHMNNTVDKPTWASIKSEFFKDLMADMLRFFEEGTPSFDPAQTLEVMKIREGAIHAFSLAEEWHSL